MTEKISKKPRKKTPRKSRTHCRKHFWMVVTLGPETKSWNDQHALGRCIHCDAWTVLEYGTLGPCSHVTRAQA